jgi:hypothetical protein
MRAWLEWQSSCCLEVLLFPLAFSLAFYIPVHNVIILRQIEFFTSTKTSYSARIRI